MENNITDELPRIEAVSVAQPSTLRLRWQGKRASDRVDLTGWIATGGEILAPLREAPIFAKASVGNYGAAVVWDDGDLAIDAAHLKMLADEQKKPSTRRKPVNGKANLASRTTKPPICFISV